MNNLTFIILTNSAMRAFASHSGFVQYRNVKPISIGYPVALHRDYKNVIPSLSHVYNNAGDPFAPPGTFDRHRHDEERKMLDTIAELWSVDKENVWGYTTSGGTEGNLEGLWLARETYPDGVLYYSDQSHYSIKKIAKILRMESVVVPSDSHGAVDIQKLKLIVDKNKPVIILANIGTTFVGAIDDVGKIKSVLEPVTNGLYIHADAAFFGFVMPFLRPGYDEYKYFDSISVSCHKWPGLPFPSGVFVSKKSYPDNVEDYIEYIAQRDVTISGSRNGHAPIFMNEFFSTTDLQKEVKDVLDMTEYIRQRLVECAPECSPWVNKNSSILVFNSPSKDIIYKWSLATEKQRSHVCVLPHITKEVANAFVHDMALYFGRR